MIKLNIKVRILIECNWPTDNIFRNGRLKRVKIKK